MPVPSSSNTGRQSSSNSATRPSAGLSAAGAQLRERDGRSNIDAARHDDRIPRANQPSQRTTPGSSTSVGKAPSSERERHRPSVTAALHESSNHRKNLVEDHRAVA
ncbi:hypothetical protein OCU04_013117 [Sclerotinia nivalis]|uniref:Uncharacterized protein n=1 Tax=Sclerotinia nivalis TaxID=352851 RepID=A0A9X0A968_9HELO|nr:hypothetical protein OCU04_013117 [Sclerotinia nivalis]